MQISHVLTVALSCGFAASVLAQPCGTPWTLGPAVGPSPRSQSAVAYDSARARVVLFGGAGGLTDTWEWAAAGPGGGGSWTLRATTGPSARTYAGMAYDSARQKTVLFGGLGTNLVANNQTWEWDGVSWTQIVPTTSPPAMPGSIMAYDSSRQRTVLVSTVYQAPSGGSTWEYDGHSWTQFLDSAPYSYNYTTLSLSFDAARSRMVLSGNAYSPAFYGTGTWERLPAGWTLRNSSTLQEIGDGPSTAYDPVRQQVVHFDNGAYSGMTGVWAWDGAAGTWSVLSSGGPPLAYGRRPVFDAAGGQVVLFGGTVIASNTTIGQTWLYRSDVRPGPTLTEIGPRNIYQSLSGPSLQLTVAATGTGPISYRWRFNGIELSDVPPFSGTGTPLFTLSPADRVYSGYYDALVTDDCGTTIRPATFVRIECYPNCDGSTSTPLLTAEDYQCFLNEYAANHSYANCDASTGQPMLTANDFQCFINAFAARCN